MSAVLAPRTRRTAEPRIESVAVTVEGIDITAKVVYAPAVHGDWYHEGEPERFEVLEVALPGNDEFDCGNNWSDAFHETVKAAAYERLVGGAK